MCDFAPGEKLICVRFPFPELGDGSPLTLGETYTCEDVYIEPHNCDCGSWFAVEIIERPEDVYCACHFGRPGARDLAAWLRTATPAPHLDKRRRQTVDA